MHIYIYLFKWMDWRALGGFAVFCAHRPSDWHCTIRIEVSIFYFLKGERTPGFREPPRRIFFLQKKPSCFPKLHRGPRFGDQQPSDHNPTTEIERVHNHGITALEQKAQIRPLRPRLRRLWLGLPPDPAALVASSPSSSPSSSSPK